ncbi:MAG: nucleotidyltransferase family protein [Betaproteobacteria bacterium]|nr:nucleotidyltransferase family protein [Betaproteobacteria bacterium]
MDNPQAQALLLAAGRGERMRPLTDHTPKPLLEVQGKPLLQWHLEGLQRGGVRSVVINTAWLEEQFTESPGTLFKAPPLPPVDIRYSSEGRDFGGALETAGGIARALPQLAPVFWVAAGDVYAPEFAFSTEDLARFAAAPALAHIWLVPNPAHNPKGDFGLSANGLALNLADDNAPRYTFSTIALYKQAFFADCGIPPGNPDGIKAPMAPLLRRGMDNGCVSATLYAGTWVDVGTPARLAELNSGDSPV